MLSNHNDHFKPNEATSDASLPTEEIGSKASLNPGRRKIARLGAPLLLTLASRSVLANQCLSNMLSGNLSDPNRDSICQKGWSPGGWGQPGGNISSYSTPGAWQAIGYSYGTMTKCDPSKNSSYSQSSCYTGGTTMGQLPSWLNKNGIPSNTRVADVLNDQSTYKPTRNLVCAYFNASLSAVSGGSFKYVMTVAQLEDLAGSTQPLPGGLSLNDFLGTTWN